MRAGAGRRTGWSSPPAAEPGADGPGRARSTGRPDPSHDGMRADAPGSGTAAPDVPGPDCPAVLAAESQSGLMPHASCLMIHGSRIDPQRASLAQEARRAAGSRSPCDRSAQCSPGAFTHSCRSTPSAGRPAGARTRRHPRREDPGGRSAASSVVDLGSFRSPVPAHRDRRSDRAPGRRVPPGPWSCRAAAAGPRDRAGPGIDGAARRSRAPGASGGWPRRS